MKLTRRKFIKLLGTATLTAATGNKVFSESGNSNLTEVKVAYPPTIAALPLAKGVQREFFLGENSIDPFLEQDIKLHLIPSRGSSDAARLVTGDRADCAITGLSSSLYAIQGTGNLKISSTAFDPNESGRHMGLAFSNLYHNVSSLNDLVENWLDNSPKNSIILSLSRDDHYATDQLMESEGYPENDDKYYLNREDLISRLNFLLNEGFVSTVLPEPLLTLALENPGFKRYQIELLSNYGEVALPPFVFAFNRKFLDKDPELIDRFYKGWEGSLKETNSSSNIQLLDLTTQIISETLPGLRNAIENAELTEEFASLFEIPSFSSPKPLNEEVFDSVLDWTISKGYLNERIPFEKAYDGYSAKLVEKSK
ncbi:twin-arginine translocation signal domain-containing protein [Candidatus Bipolaricaulota bacterium]|nr:twin-arginine translocation signal domain-containing protein [Candidatus Bipolaricaulota bacterium]